MNPLYEKFKDKNVNEINKEFIDACVSGDINTVKYLLCSPELEERADINFDSCDGLFFAVINNHIELVKFLLTSSELSKHADMSKKSSNDSFVAACSNGHIEILNFFLKTDKVRKQINMDRVEQGLEFACQNSKLDIIKYLLDFPGLRMKANQDNAFRKAYDWGKIDVIQYLIFDLNIERSPYISLYLGRNPNEKIEGWFKLRDVNNKLNEELKTNQPSKSTKIKI
jgi:ankyrin repeat protein